MEQNGTVACGTAMGNRLKVPPLLKTEPLEKGQHSFGRNQNMLMVRYEDKKEIYFLSTIHEANTGRVAKWGRNDISVSKLTLVNDYNKNMVGVDCNDTVIGNYSLVRKTRKWTMKVVMHFIEEAVFNSFTLYDKVNPGKLRFMQFKLHIMKKTINRARAINIPQIYHVPQVGRHFLELISATEKKSTPQKKCVACTKNRVRNESMYQCKN